MAAHIVVFDYAEPRQKLMAWFLSDSGLHNVRVTAVEDLRHALLATPRVLVINSNAENEEIAGLVAEVRGMDGGRLRIIVLHGGQHKEDETPIDADICVHYVGDVDALVEAARAALADDIPDPDPHEAGEEVTDR